MTTPTAPTDTPEALAGQLKILRARRSDIVCGLLTASMCDKLDAEQDALIDRLASLAAASAASLVVEPVAYQYWTAGEFWTETSRLGYEARRDAGGKVRPLFSAPLPASPAQPVVAAIDDARTVIVAAREWIVSAGHGDDCFVSNHYEGDPGNQCNCGLESLLAHIDMALDPESIPPALVGNQTLLLKAVRHAVSHFNEFSATSEGLAASGFGLSMDWLETMVGKFKQDAAPKVEAPVARAAGEAWTLTAPDGRQWHADSALKCAAAEQRERIPAKTALDRIFADVDAFELEERAAIAKELEPHSMRAGDCPPDSMVVTSYAIKRTLATPKAEPPASGLRAETDAGDQSSKE